MKIVMGILLIVMSFFFITSINTLENDDMWNFMKSQIPGLSDSQRKTAEYEFLVIGIILFGTSMFLLMW